MAFQCIQCLLRDARRLGHSPLYVSPTTLMPIPGRALRPAPRIHPSNESAAAALRNSFLAEDEEDDTLTVPTDSGIPRSVTAASADGLRIVFLGTGCAEPSKVSLGIYV